MDDPTIGVKVDSAPLEPPTPLVHFGRFDILGRLAVGGMAEIFLAEEPVGTHARRVVIKVLHRQFRADRTFEKMFLREGAIAMQLAHPNISAIHEFAKHADQFYIAMEHIDGVSLWDLFGKLTNKRERMPPEFAVAICARVAAALDYAHNATDAKREPLGVIHRDVSPHNIMVRFDGVVKLVDFGVAKMKAREDSAERSTVKGKSAYLSPEQCMSDDLDGRTDVFSLGICLAEALTGKRLFRRDSPFDTVKAIVEDPVPSVRERVHTLPEDLAAIVAKALSKSREDRYESAAAFQIALERWLQAHDHVVTDATIRQFLLQHYPTESDRTPILDRGPEAVERLRALVPLDAAPPSRTPMYLLAAVAVVLAIGFGAWTWSQRQPIPERVETSTPPRMVAQPMQMQIEVAPTTPTTTATARTTTTASEMATPEPSVERAPTPMAAMRGVRSKNNMRSMRIRRDPGF